MQLVLNRLSLPQADPDLQIARLEPHDIPSPHGDGSHDRKEAAPTPDWGVEILMYDEDEDDPDEEEAFGEDEEFAGDDGFGEDDEDFLEDDDEAVEEEGGEDDEGAEDDDEF